MDHWTQKKIGIITDSHGDATVIEKALFFLKAEGCQTIYHLGDICDSSYLMETAACLKLLQNNRVLAIKGNNDHVITCYHETHDKLQLSQAQRAYLMQLPLVLEYENAVFTHSLPFEKELGLSCMIGALDEAQVQRFFNRFPHKLLFRGHGHDPEIITPAHGSQDPIPLPVAEPIDLNGFPSIVTCGALTDRLCLVWQPQTQLLSSLHF